MKDRVYFDNAATTKVDERVLKKMQPFLEDKYGNASSQHKLGIEAKKALEESREQIASVLNCKPSEIIFTSGGTESINFAIKGTFNKNKNLIITTKAEHAATLRTVEWLETMGAKAIYLDVDKEGFIDIKKLEKSITNKTSIVSIIHANNEVGTVPDIEAIGKICKEKGVLLHLDACQSFTKIPIDTKKINVDLITINSHKIHGPKGVGALYIKQGTKIEPLMQGGAQEDGLRSGTSNIQGIVGFAEATKSNTKEDIQKMKGLQEKLIEGLLKIPNTKLNGPRKNRLCNNINISFNNIDGEALSVFLENSGILTSTGSACKSNSQKASHVLQAIGNTKKQVDSSLRISISKYTTEKEVEYFLKEIKRIVEKLRSINQ